LIPRIFKTRAAAVTAGAAALVIASSAGGAIAASMITSGDIQDNTIRSVDIHDGGVHANDLSLWAQNQLGRVKHITKLNGDFSATSDTVSMTPDGVNFGPYADGGSGHGSIEFTGLNGAPLSAVKNLVYYIRYVADNDTGGVGVPYLRVFLDNGANPDKDAIFSPNTQAPDPDIAQGPFHEWVATSGSWRYQDDIGDGPDEPFSQLINDHGTETITGIYISTGFTSGTNLQALLRWMQVNGTTYAFGS
jgi:hypothetical protein